jgi:hypothetical protein
LTAIDLDGNRSFAAHDEPEVGQARCCKATESWGACSWVGIEQAGLNSHAKGGNWCPEGSAMTALDLDGNRSYSAMDEPEVGAAQCCSIASGWDSCLWVEVGAFRSHQSWYDWCPDGTFATALDLDRAGSLDDHDSPVIGRVRCCAPVGPAGATLNGRTFVIVGKDSGRCMEVSGQGKANGDNVVIWGLQQGSTSQQWRFESLSGGLYKIINVNSGLCLDVDANDEGALGNNANVQQWTYVGNQNQKWRIEYEGDGYYHIVSAYSGKCLDVAYYGTGNGSNVQQWGCHGGGNQLWKLQEVF